MRFLSGDLTARNQQGRPIRDDSCCLLFNAHREPITFTVPGAPWGLRRAAVIDTARAGGFPEPPEEYEAGAQIESPGLSLIVLRRIAP